MVCSEKGIERLEQVVIQMKDHPPACRKGFVDSEEEKKKNDNNN